MMIHRLIAILALTTTVVPAGFVLAQGAFPAPLPGQAAPTTKEQVLSSENSGQLHGPVVASECMKDFAPLREDAEKKGKLIKQASDRHAPSQEACKLIGDYSQAELKMIEYVEVHAANCSFPAGVMDQLKAGHKNTDVLQTKVCALAMKMRRGWGADGPPVVSDFGDPVFSPRLRR
jgi:hypothetical protein